MPSDVRRKKQRKTSAQSAIRREGNSNTYGNSNVACESDMVAKSAVVQRGTSTNVKTGIGYMSQEKKKRVSLERNAKAKIGNGRRIHVNTDYNYWRKRIVRRYVRLYRKERRCDCYVFRTDDPIDLTIIFPFARFSCHKIVLAQHSHYFEALLGSDWAEAQSSTVHLQDVDPTDFLYLLYFFYYDQLRLTRNNIQSITEVSTRFQAIGALKQCDSKVCAMVNKERCLSLMEFAWFYSLSDAYAFCRKFALWHFPEVRHTEEFLSASLAQVRDYLRDPYLNIDSEVEVFIAAAAWYAAQEESGMENLVDLFGSLVNFDNMTADDLKALKAEVSCLDQKVKDFVEGLREGSDDLTALRAKSAGRKRQDFRSGRILCVGAHQCQNCEECQVAERTQAPMEVLEFDPDSCLLRPYNDLSRILPPLCLESGYKVCAIGYEVYVVGGKAHLERRGWLTDVWCLNTMTNSWSQKTKLREVRRHLSLCSSGDLLYLVGGVGEYRVLSNLLETFNIVTKKWRELPEMLEAEISPAVAIVNCKLYVCKNFLQVFDLDRESWSLVEHKLSPLGLPILAHPLPDSSSVLWACEDSLLLYRVDLSTLSVTEEVMFDNPGGGNVRQGKRFFRFQSSWKTPLGYKDVEVERYVESETDPTTIGTWQNTTVSLNWVTVPYFPPFSLSRGQDSEES